MARKYFDVLVQKNGRIQWMEVPGCINHAEARAQGEEMYDGKVLQTRFNGVENDDDDSSDGGMSSGLAGLSLLAVAVGLFLVISMWPIFVIGGIIYGLYKIFKK